MNKEQENDRLAKFEKGSLEYYQEKDIIQKEKAREYYYRNRKGIDATFFFEQQQKLQAELLVKYVGQVGDIKIPHTDARFSVRVLNVKKEYGKIRFFVEPIDGEGQFWTEKVLFSSIG